MKKITKKTLHLIGSIAKKQKFVIKNLKELKLCNALVRLKTIQHKTKTNANAIRRQFFFLVDALQLLLKIRRWFLRRTCLFTANVFHWKLSRYKTWQFNVIFYVSDRIKIVRVYWRVYWRSSYILRSSITPGIMTQLVKYMYRW